MQAWALSSFGMDGLSRCSAAAVEPAAGQVAVRVRAMSLNYRDLMVIRGDYNPRFRLPATPISDGAGEVIALGDGVTRVRMGDHVLANFVTGWIDGPFRVEYLASTLGMPGPGMSAERVLLPETALLPLPRGYDFAQAATLPIAALTAWSALVTEGGLDPAGSNAGKTVLTLGTGGVSIFALQFAHALGAKVIITSSSDEKLERARALGADETINYRTTIDWPSAVTRATDGAGADITVETGGGGTLDHSVRATRAGGRVCLLGALTGLKSELNTGAVLMRRIRISGVMVDCMRAMQEMIAFIEDHDIRPIIDRKFTFGALPDALKHMQSGGHFGKIVVDGA